MTPGLVEAITHTLVTLALIVGYIVLTLHGDDATPVLAVLGGYVGGTAVTKATQGPRA